MGSVGRPADEIRAEYPDFFEAKQLVADIRAGEMLYLPTGWFHEVHSFGETSENQGVCTACLEYRGPWVDEVRLLGETSEVGGVCTCGWNTACGPEAFLPAGSTRCTPSARPRRMEVCVLRVWNTEGPGWMRCASLARPRRLEVCDVWVELWP